ncbi:MULTISPECIES: hypothetical protein [unclassified Lysobacter]|uniref:hypothetical protein n=1 Tax=unclassified Lysobacter TaxID=2635362 RepID=UPI0006F720A4|nr:MULTISPECIES: hypothetical protein [unclassified Lysobacter]KQZ63589.1 hypothetical protein ASD53_18825 [Lysobacter sp. Root559]
MLMRNGFPNALPAIRLTALACLLCVGACATTAAGPAAVQEKPAMTESTPATANDMLDAQQLNERVLAWILSVRDARDLSAQNIEKHTGIKFKVDPEDPNGFYAVGALTGAWRYSLTSIKALPGSHPGGVDFDMGVSGDNDADMTPVCIGLNSYQQALIAAGFRLSQLPAHVGVEYRRFRSDKASVLIYLRGKTKRYDEQLCVFRIVVNAPNRKK